MSFLPLRKGKECLEIGAECMGVLDSYTFVKGIYGGYDSRGHQIMKGTLYTSISNIMVPLSTPIQDVYTKTVILKN